MSNKEDLIEESNKDLIEESNKESNKALFDRQ